MSRLGKLPVAIPEKVKASVDGQSVSIEGPKGKLEQSFDRAVKIEMTDAGIQVTPVNDSRLSRAMLGTARSIIDNMVKGVVTGYEKNLEIQGVGFRAALKGKVVELALGYSHDIKYPLPENVTVAIAENTKIKVTGPDKQSVGQVAADIKSFYPAEPYKGKGVRIVGEYVRRKEGKKTG